MKVSALGLITALIILGVSVVVYYVLLIWFAILLAVVKYGLGERAAQPVYRLFNTTHSRLEQLWFTFVASVLEIVEGTKVSYTVVDGAGQSHLEGSKGCTTDGRGQKRPLLWHILSPPSGPGKVKIIMLNHHCRVDWIYLFLFCARSAMTPTMRIVLKEDLKKIPMMGCAMEHYRFLFLSRNWQSDEAYLKEMVSYLQRSGEPTTILIFPEGTDLSPSNITKSQEYAQKNNLPVMRHVLNPRTTGLVALKNMFGKENVEEIVDCTMGYTYGVRNTRPAEPSLVDGNYPRRVHLLIRRYRLDCTTSPNPDGLTDIAPGSDDALLKRWVEERFAEKEQLLSRFYGNNPVGFDEHDVRAVMGDTCGVLSYDGLAAGAAGGRDSLFARVKEFTEEIGWARMVANVVIWFVTSAYIVARTNPLLLFVYVAAMLYGQMRVMKRFKGTQRLLFLDQVRDDETWLAKLTGKAKKN